MRVLVTSGATREPIDGVRFLTNISTGRTGARIAERFAAAGHDVIHLVGQDAVRTQSAKHSREFRDFQDLDGSLKRILAETRVDAIIHLAAVSDYSVDRIEVDGDALSPDPERKLGSEHELVIRLKRNFKIVHRLKSYGAGSEPLIVAFKLTQGAAQEEKTQAISKVFGTGGLVDFVVHNDHSEISPQHHPFEIHDSEGVQGRCTGAYELAEALIEILEKRIRRNP